tara:strand:+ start:6380 stop:6526 length:147 start_codon:yes stop_codon:yes gene_type:complete
LINQIQEQLELFVEEEEPLPTWGEILEDPETKILACGIILFFILTFVW